MPVCSYRLQACGSSGTALGIALGSRLAGMGLRVHAYCVCASPAFFYRHCDSLLAELGATPDVLGCDAEGLLRWLWCEVPEGRHVHCLHGLHLCLPTLTTVASDSSCWRAL